MELDAASLKRIKTFMELLQRAKQQGSQPSFVSTPTEHGDNINMSATIDGTVRQECGMARRPLLEQPDPSSVLIWRQDAPRPT